jgi:hypothetical protein
MTNEEKRAYHAQKAREWYWKNKEKVIAYQRDYRKYGGFRVNNRKDNKCNVCKVELTDDNRYKSSTTKLCKQHFKEREKLKYQIKTGKVKVKKIEKKRIGLS